MRTKTKFTISSYDLANAISNLPKGAEYCTIDLSDYEQIAIDLLTKDILYFNDKTGEETYLETIQLLDN